MSLNADLPDDVFIFEEQGTSTGIYTFAAIALGFIGFFGFILNLLVVVTVIRNANVLWTPNNVVLVNMVVSKHTYMLYTYIYYIIILYIYIFLSYIFICNNLYIIIYFNNLIFPGNDQNN